MPRVSTDLFKEELLRLVTFPVLDIFQLLHCWQNLSTIAYKVVADKRSRLIVGVQIISHQASDWMPILLLLIKKGVTVPILANASNFEGTRFQGVCEAAKACLKSIKTG